MLIDKCDSVNSTKFTIVIISLIRRRKVKVNVDVKDRLVIVFEIEWNELNEMSEKKLDVETNCFRNCWSNSFDFDRREKNDFDDVKNRRFENFDFWLWRLKIW